MNFQDTYSRPAYLNFFRDTLLPDDFEVTEESVPLGFQADRITDVIKLGEVPSLDLPVFEIKHKSENDPRVTLSKEAFRILANYGKQQALILFVSTEEQAPNFRLSLITLELKLEGKRVIKDFSNPRRYSFFLGPQCKAHTPEQYLSKRIIDMDDLKNRFSIEVVNEDFYTQIAMRFTDLVGGSRKIGTKTYKQKGLIKYPGGNEQESKEFAVRLIGRLVFCWFLKKKHSENNIPLVPENILSLKVIKDKENTYHSILEPLFFEVLNKKLEVRHENYKKSGWEIIPFLNGGLFTPHDDDHYTPDEFQGISPRGDLKIPDKWLEQLLKIFERYNFTIDENTSVDVELSIDPEMLGRIFENLLAEINPQTGETARKATGSYYTPRPIVEYMVDQSIKQYLLTQTGILEQKIDSLLDYSKDFADANLSDRQSDAVIEALDKLKVLDPACGSGAFPMGVLQKMLLILHKVDPDSTKWKTRLLDKIPNAAARKALSEKLASETWQYIHKLGIIQNSIYGVDIQPIATEISKLRVFLSLIVDETVNDSKYNRGVEPLPNLKYKIVCGDSLIDKFMGSIIKTDSSLQTKSKKIVDKLTGLKAEYFSAENEKERVKYNLEILRNKLTLAEQLLADLKDKSQFTGNLFGSEAQTKKEKEEKAKSIVKKRQADLLNKAIENARDDINNLMQKTKIESVEVERLEAKHFEDSFVWRLDFAEIFTYNNGFDIVIANPPYLGEKGHKDIFRMTKQGNLSRFYQGKMDLFYFFFHLALTLGKQNSSIAFITTNYYITAHGAKKLRKDFKDRAIIKTLINFNELRIFKSALGQHNMITVLNKDNDERAVAVTSISQRNGIATAEVLQQIVAGSDADTQYSKIVQQDLYDGPEYYIRIAGNSENSKDPIQNILDNVKKRGDLLGTICHVNTGLFTAADKIFIFERDEISEKLQELNKLEKSLFKPFFKNSDIYSYCTSHVTNKRVLYHYEKADYKLSDIPNVFAYLKKRKETLENRKDNSLKGALKRGRWDVMSLPKTAIDFAGKKIVAPQRSKINTFGYNEIPWYASADVYFITEKDNKVSLKYVLALLNSKIYYQWLYHRGKRKGETLELYQKPLSEIPIKKITESDQKPFIALVDKILTAKKQNPAADTTKLENQIDQMVYDLYGLTADEIAIVEDSVK